MELESLYKAREDIIQDIILARNQSPENLYILCLVKQSIQRQITLILKQ